MLNTESGGTLRSYRNRALLAILIGCGLRRAEVTTSRSEDFQLQEGHCVIADLGGKGGHSRTIPVPEWVKGAVDSWTLAAGIDAGPLFRSIDKADKIWGDGDQGLEMPDDAARWRSNLHFARLIRNNRSPLIVIHVGNRV